MSTNFMPIQFQNDKLILLDQRKLPLEEVYLEFSNIEQVHQAIKSMIVRGAPCIGFTAIFGMALWLKDNPCLVEIDKAATLLKSARPTAVNLNFEIDRVMSLVNHCKDLELEPYQEVVKFGHAQILKSEQENRQMAKLAERDLDSTLARKKYRILTHCNTGFLACGSIGTALGVVQNLFEQGKLEQTWVDETRPYLQGSRLTAYELEKLKAPHKIVVEGAASYLMKNNLVDAIFTGADRVVANGDTANKVGTSNLAILAKYYDIPFYIVAPSSSFDLSIKDGSDIKIELRDEAEILSYNDQRIAPLNSKAYNPSFDVTDGELISGIISEKGVAKGDYLQTLKEIVND